MNLHQDAGVANFVQKTFEILRSNQYQHIITWMHNGRDFVIKQAQLFQEVILPKFFRHRNVNSFIRQLNMYGFHKSRKEFSKLIFSHPYFLEGKEELLGQVRRKIKSEDKYQQYQQKPQQNQLVQSIQMNISQSYKQRILKDQPPKQLFSKPHRNSILNETILSQNMFVPQSEKSLFQINSFFNIDFESFQFKSLISKSIIEINPSVYERLQEGPSLREIGSEQYLNLCGQRTDAMNMDDDLATLGSKSFAVRIFQTKNCIFEFDL